MQPPAAAAPEPVEDGQQGQTDSGFRCRGDDTVRELGEMIVGRASRLMMDVVKLRHGGKSGLQHLHLGEGGDRLDLLRTEPFEKAVHQPAPGPEAVVRVGTAPLGQTGHGALKGVAVQVDRPGEKYAETSPLWRRAGNDLGNPAVLVDVHANVALPSLARQRLLRPECFHAPHRFEARRCPTRILRIEASASRAVGTS